MNKQTFKIPENCKFITQELDVENNRIITTFEPEFKRGDIVFCKESKDHATFVFDKIDKIDKIDKYNEVFVICGFGYAGLFLENCTVSFLNPTIANDKQKAQFYENIAEEGKQWNPETLCVEDLKVIPKVGDCVKAYDIDGSIRYLVVDSITGHGRVCARGMYCYKEHSKSATLQSKTKCLFSGGFQYKILSEDRFQKELNDLGFEYNFDNDTIKEIKWSPKEGEAFYYFSGLLNPIKNTNTNNSAEKNLISDGNCFKTKEECEEAILKIKNLLK